MADTDLPQMPSYGTNSSPQDPRKRAISSPFGMFPAGLIFLSLAENPGDGNHIHVLYQGDNAQNPASLSFDQQQPFLNWGSPLLPCCGIETMN
jgi:hypothetical protein